MSHQDECHGTRNAEDLQAALDWLVPAEVLADIEFRRGSFWTPLSLVFAALMWSWSGETALTERFAQARRILALMLPLDEQPGGSYQGFMKRLHCWSDKLLERVTREFRRYMREELSGYFLVADWLLLAADGSRSAMPRTRSNERRFASRAKKGKKGKKSKRRSAKRRQKQLRETRRYKKQSQADRDKKAATPQIWITMLYHVTLGLPWAWRSGPSDSSERAHLSEMAQELPGNALVVNDAGFVGYGFWKGLNNACVSFVARIGGNVKLLKNLGYVRRQGSIVYVWPDKAQRDKQPPLVLRLECFSGGQERVYLVTNVLDATRLSVSQMIEIYAARWRVEVYYRDLKQTFKREKLRSKSADNAQLELDWSIVGLWAMCLYATAEHVAAGIEPRERSVANMLRAFRRPMQEYKSTPEEGEDMDSLMAKAIKDNYQRKSSKAGRDHPRKKKKRRLGEPKITLATAEQRKAARRIKKTQHAAA